MTLLDFYIQQRLSFADGVALLRSHQGAALLSTQTWTRLQMLAQQGTPPDKYNLGKLTDALAKIKHHPDHPAATIGPAAPAPTDAQPNTATSARAKRLHKEHSHHHATMFLATTDAERAAAAEKVLEVVADLDAEYNRIREGKGMEEDANPAPAEGIRSEAQILRKLQTIRSRISEARRKLSKNLSPQNRQEIEAKLQKLLAEKESLEDLIQ